MGHGHSQESSERLSRRGRGKTKDARQTWPRIGDSPILNLGHETARTAGVGYILKSGTIDSGTKAGKGDGSLGVLVRGGGATDLKVKTAKLGAGS